MRHRLTAIILIGLDLVIFAITALIAYPLHKNSENMLLSHMAAALAYIVTAWLFNLYRASLAHFGVEAAKQTVMALSASAAILILFGLQISTVILQGSTLAIAIIGYRVAAREFLFQRRHSNAIKTLVYGAGAAGIQFVSAAMQGEEYNVVGYIDDNRDLAGQTFHGRKVAPTAQLGFLINKFRIELIVVAIPSATSTERMEVLEKLLEYRVRVVTIPSVQDIIEGKQQITQTDDISYEDLLAREPVPPIKHLMDKPTQGKVCLVTGAGGSIGSELCRQIAKCEPQSLLLLDSSEPSLFAIEQELLRSGFQDVKCILGSVTDENLVTDLFTRNNIESVFHAAAYKHVPMVEANPLAGLVNNVYGTRVILDAAEASACASFTLVSTDKAVRPTNVMGATKRIAEMLCQIKSSESRSSLVVSIVRFGNVLGSSGSVIPTFQRQIREGGPITLTHEDVTRYFMTIPEAAQLVMQASGMANSGDLFLLDMGQPVKIRDVAERLIRLSGKRIADKSSSGAPDEVKIEITGLRPGEKLYEELLVDNNATETLHPKILKARERFLDRQTLEDGLVELETALTKTDNAEFTRALSRIVQGYQPDSRHA